MEWSEYPQLEWSLSDAFQLPVAKEAVGDVAPVTSALGGCWAPWLEQPGSIPGLLQLLTDDGGLLDGPLPSNQLPVTQPEEPKATFLELKPAELFEQQLQEAEKLQQLEDEQLKIEDASGCKLDQQPPDLLALITDSLGLAADSPLAPLSPEDVDSCVPPCESYMSMYEVPASSYSPQQGVAVCPVSMYDPAVSPASAYEVCVSPGSLYDSAASPSPSCLSSSTTSPVQHDHVYSSPGTSQQRGSVKRLCDLEMTASRQAVLEERRERKKQQNKEAALRYREKKRLEAQGRQDELKALEDRNAALRTQVEDTHREVALVRGLLLEMRATQRRHAAGVL